MDDGISLCNCFHCLSGALSLVTAHSTFCEISQLILSVVPFLPSLSPRLPSCHCFSGAIASLDYSTQMSTTQMRRLSLSDLILSLFISRWISLWIRHRVTSGDFIATHTFITLLPSSQLFNYQTRYFIFCLQTYSRRREDPPLIRISNAVKFSKNSVLIWNPVEGQRRKKYFPHHSGKLYVHVRSTEGNKIQWKIDAYDKFTRKCHKARCLVETKRNETPPPHSASHQNAAFFLSAWLLFVSSVFQCCVYSKLLGKIQGKSDDR